MRIRNTACLLILAFLLLSPRPASAQLGFLRWWDSLSGPEHFEGPGVDLAFVCYGINMWKVPVPRDATVFLDPGCYRAARRSVPRLSFGLQWARLTGDNMLPYPAGVSPPAVHAFPFFFTTDVGVHHSLDLGASLGWVRFSGDGFGFSRFAIEPRITFKPLVFLGKKDDSERKLRRLEVLQFRLSGVGLPGEFTAADFGAIGDFKSSRDFLFPAYTIRIDLTPLLFAP